MNNKGRILYWDSNVFLSHLNGIPERIKTINAILAEIKEDDNSIIMTSSESIVEVSQATYEKADGKLDPRVEVAIDEMWEDSSIVKIIDNGSHIAIEARKLIRSALPNNWSLKPKDAIHLASALWYNKNVERIEEFHTYDDRLFKYQTMIGIPICHPHVLQYRMDFDDQH